MTESVSSDDSLEFYSTLTRESFQYNVTKLPEGRFSPSELLVQSYKYWSLDDLTKSLGSLLHEIDQELIDLVNNDYLNFIELGNSIDGSVDLIHDCKIDLNGYIRDLSVSNMKIDADLETVDSLLLYKRKLSVYRAVVNQLVVLEEQLTLFSKKIATADVRELVVLFLSTNKIYSALLKYRSLEMVAVAGKKIAGMKIELKSVLDSKLATATDDEKLQLLKVYSVLGEERAFIRAVRKKDN
ncbi:hypothetical protein KL930_003834 [Ogataea haglerorum]|uniref:Conserved oligomeric Golgi complex subunit 2 n=1 Tax=Ogataea haglerorum TaxID=1937702 RepID=A0ABQ7RCK2_9ASCO|nr:uncharacterized protein KL911_003974 [Ogataea haglerorum]KAG7695285.1 hypothetical protein KL951_003727 [Ogataea haglerorum]KAG7705149.1 hypothetical protein KL914_003835 [Ogataea haglerorum]KAG7716725.1 hypothetical protein KL913_003241 [Ogataea haglerorum]KAG7717522.1 hypothetical protein KL949_003356 [Ogataea haglerorum]KAG7740551.1 hypothetical protein KL932_002910 [Ogataea haglerorum]